MTTKPHNVVHRYLDNGMEVYLHETDFAPIVSLQVLVKVGSIDEEENEGGIAHVLEHMIFKGTQKYPTTGQVARTVEESGGEINAYTCLDHTNYYLTAPSHFTNEGLKLLLDVVQNSMLDEEELKRELEVIVEEILRQKDNPNATVSQQLFSAFYRGTRLERPVIGKQSTVENFSRSLIYDFYKKWYIPNNMIFIAAGDFNPQEIFEHLNELSRSFLPKTVPQRFRPTLPDFGQNPICTINRGNWQEARIQIATAAPALEDSEMPIWDAFSSILGESDSSRLVRVLRDDLQIVTHVDASCYTPRYPKGLIGVGFFSMAHTVQEALKNILREIQRLAEVPPTQEELMRVVNALKAHRIYGKESMDGITRTAGLSLQTSKKMDFENDYIKRISQVTIQEIQKVASKVLSQFVQGSFVISGALNKEFDLSLTEESLLKVVQESIQKNASEQESIEKDLENINSPHYKKEESWIHSYPQIISELNESIQQIQIQLPYNKVLKINFRKSKRLAITSGMLVAKGGLIYEPNDKNGLSGLMASMLTRGTQRQSYRKFIEELEDNASNISAFSGRDIFGMRFDSMTENCLRTIQMTLDCLFRPEFSHSEWQRLKKETREILIAQKDSPIARLAKISQPMLFPHHPYAFSSVGTEKSLENIHSEDAVQYWHEIFHADEFIFSIAGDFDLRSIVNLLENEFKNYLSDFYLKRDRLALFIAQAPTLNDHRIAFDELQREQVHISLAFRSVPINDKRRTALEIASNILAGQGGRLFLDLRDKRSLAYSVSASHIPNLCAGAFSTYIATSVQKVREALEGLKWHLELLASKAPSNAELMRAQNSLIGAQSIESQHHSYQAAQLAMSDVYGLGFDNFLRFKDRIQSVNAEMLTDVLRSIMNENPPVISIVGNKETWIPNAQDPICIWNFENKS